MHSMTGKLFRRLETNSIECLQYDYGVQDYYRMVQEMINRGYRQIICTSSVMVAIIEHYLVRHNAVLISIDFLQEDDELNEEIKAIISKLRDNGAYWAILKERLEFLSKYDSIDIKQVAIKCIEGDGYIFSLKVNGLLSISENKFKSVSDEIVEVVEEVLC